MATFRVQDGHTTVLETDDWVEAERCAVNASPQRSLSVIGTHPTHDWDRREPTHLSSSWPPAHWAAPMGALSGARCRRCGAWDNGSYGSHAPCGYDWSKDSLMAALDREEAARTTTQPKGLS